MTAPKPAHQDDAAVDALAATMKAKLAKQRAKGYSGWDTPEFTQQRLSDMLREHVDKGDPVDVANFCAFLAARGEGITHAAPAAQRDALDAARESEYRRGQHWSEIDGIGNELRAEALDTAIDAALSAQGGKKGGNDAK